MSPNNVIYQSTNASLEIYQSIINQVNLDFTGTKKNNFLQVNTSLSSSHSSYHSSFSTSPNPFSLPSSPFSPIIERIKINEIFNNAITSINTANNQAITYINTANNTVSYSPLRIQTQGIHTNRSYFIIDSILMSRPRSTELLNYHSNILYCMVNNVSPSTY